MIKTEQYQEVTSPEPETQSAPIDKPAEEETKGPSSASQVQDQPSLTIEEPQAAKEEPSIDTQQ